MRPLVLALVLGCAPPREDTGLHDTPDTAADTDSDTDADSDADSDSDSDADADTDADADSDADADTDADTDSDADADTDTTPPDWCAATVAAPPSSLGLDPFYTKYLDADGIPIVSSDGVDDAAFSIACEIALHMLSARPDVHTELVANGGRIAIMATDEVTSDIPEHSHLNDTYPNTNWDLYRGLGGTMWNPLTTCGEENLLQLQGDVYAAESILVHEFAHGLFNLGVEPLTMGSDFALRLEAAYDDALTGGLWVNTYADDTVAEYWAEGVQSWFGANASSEPPNGIHNHVDTRAELWTYDPDLAALIAEVFPDDAWVVP